MGTRKSVLMQDEKLLTQWQQLVHEIMGPANDIDRERKRTLKKKLGSTTELKENLILTKKIKNDYM